MKKCSPIIFPTLEEAETVRDELIEWGYQDLVISKRNYQSMGEIRATESFVIVQEIPTREPYSNAKRTLYLRTNSIFL